MTPCVKEKVEKDFHGSFDVQLMPGSKNKDFESDLNSFFSNSDINREIISIYATPGEMDLTIVFNGHIFQSEFGKVQMALHRMKSVARIETKIQFKKSLSLTPGCRS